MIACEGGEVVFTDLAGDNTDGTSDSDRPDTSADSDPSADTDAADSDAPADTDSADSDPPDVDSDLPPWLSPRVGPCAPPDLWTGGVDPALFTTTPYPPTYDAGVAAVEPLADGWGSGGVPSRVVARATVVARAARVAWLADGLGAVPVRASESLPVPPLGAKVIVSIGQRNGFELAANSAFVVVSEDNPVFVRETPSGALQWERDRHRLMHLHGEILRPSASPCGTGFSCFMIRRGATTYRIRVPLPNTWGLDLDYDGGLCGEVIAPVLMTRSPSGEAIYLDVREPDWMRVWEAP